MTYKEQIVAAAEQQPRRKALASSTGNDQVASSGRAGDLKLARMSEIEPQEVEWLWEGRLAVGKSHLLVGNPGLGKSFVLTDWAARITKGIEWPDGRPVGQTGDVVFLVGEDGLADTIRPRLDLHGADCSRVFVIRSRYLVTGDGDVFESHIQLERDLNAIDQLLADQPDVRALFIDPISEYLGRTDSNKNEDVRNILAPLSAMCERHNVAAVSVTHLNKSVGGPAIYRAMGSLAFTAQARIAWAFISDQEDPERVLFLPLKNNLHRSLPGLAFSVTNEGVVWESEEITITADEAMEPRKGKAATKLNRAVDWLKNRLAGDCVASDVLEHEADKAGISRRTYWRARKELNVIAVKDRSSREKRWFISLPDLPSEEVPHNNIDGIVGIDGTVAESANYAKSATPPSTGNVGTGPA